jgi:hypothetical protein
VAEKNSAENEKKAMESARRIEVTDVFTLWYTIYVVTGKWNSMGAAMEKFINILYLFAEFAHAQNLTTCAVSTIAGVSICSKCSQYDSRCEHRLQVQSVL